MPGTIRLACACLLAGAMTGAWAGKGIYQCVDAKGRRLTSDRPIAECADREQKELNPSGTLRRIVPPVPTATERAAQEDVARRQSEERQRLAEQKRVDKLLLARYPTQSSFEADRARTLQSVTDPEEKKRIAARYDAELARMKPLWAQNTTAANEGAPLRQ